MAKINEKLIVLLILRLFVLQHRVNCFVGVVLSLVQFAWSAFEVYNTVEDTYLKHTTVSTDDLMQKSNEIAASLDKWGGRIEEKIDQTVETLLIQLPLITRIDNDLRLLKEYVGRIDGLYSDLKRYFKHPEYYSNESFRGMIKVFTSSDGDDVEITINQMYQLLVPQKLAKFKESLFLLLAQQTQMQGLKLCDTGSTPQQRLIDFYGLIMETEMKGFAMMGFGYSMKGRLTNQSLIADVKRAQIKLFERARLYLLVLKSTINIGASRFRRCDPLQGHQRGVTFYEFERFLQSYVVQASILVSNNKCWKSCWDVEEPVQQNHGCIGFGCEKTDHSCYGRLSHCAKMPDTPRSTMCRNSPSDARRYEWIEVGNSDVLGDNSNGCPNGEIVQAFWKWIENYGFCALCRCICVEDTPDSKASHFISLREQITNTADNMVAIGFAWVIVNKIAHIKIMQGKLGPQLEVFENSTSWLELEDIYYDREGSIAAGKPKFVKKTADGDDEEMVNDEDVAAFTYEQRLIHLDSLRVQKNYVITGLRFRRLTEQAEKPVQLELHATAFNNETGQLDLDSSTWVTPNDMLYTKRGKQRTQYGPEQYNNPINSVRTEISSKPNQLVKLVWSERESDASQTVNPWLDGLPIVSDPPLPLVGLGIYYKRQLGYAGFLTLVVDGISQGPYIPTDFDEQSFEKSLETAFEMPFGERSEK